MRARDVVGRRIVGIEQRLLESNAGRVWHVDGIILDDGRRIRFVVGECLADYVVEVIVSRKKAAVQP